MFTPPPPYPALPESELEEQLHMTGFGALVGLGPEMFINGHFHDGATSWSIVGADGTHIITFADSTMRYQSDTTTPQLLLYNTIPTPVIIGKYYKLIIVTSSYTSGGLKADCMPGTPALGTVLGTQSFVFRAISIPTFAFTRNSANVDTTIDMVSLRRVL